MWTQLRKQVIMESLPCKYEDKKSQLKTNNNSNQVCSTPTMSSGKIKKKKKLNQLQSSTQSLESSSEKKDEKLNTLGNNAAATAKEEKAQQVAGQ